MTAQHDTHRKKLTNASCGGTHHRPKPRMRIRSTMMRIGSLFSGAGGLDLAVTK
ncbi:Uncharacterised protein [Mycobacterium xenopi]|uniref:Uncharacterized protein n=1 Tax=Mycobacterium xenopi TaxID=1789 RepID=A0AAD1GZJ1_MYCXE|nr:hypothetical protein MYXE_19310 [Mycobacterium xenopi]SPX77980.1 Uncharacterised protein [Mycobacterium xenopi]